MMSNYRFSRVTLVAFLAGLLLSSCDKSSQEKAAHKGFYFAITTIDQWGNESELSNVVYEPRVVESAVTKGALSSGLGLLKAGNRITSNTAVDALQEGVVNIKFKESMRAELSGSPMGRASRVGATAAVSGISAVDRAAQAIEGGVSYQRVFKYIEKHEAKARAHGLDLWYTVSFDGSRVPVSRAISTFAAVDQIEVVEGAPSIGLPDNRVTEFVPSKGDGVISHATSGAEPPFNDPYLYRQWHYDNRVGITTDVARGGHVNLFRAWKKQTGNPSVIVAIIDSGIDLEHEDLKDAMWVNSGEVPGNEVDDDGNGYIDDVHGWDFIRDEGSLSHSDSHGTHVAGTVGATNNNGIGVCGIAGGSGRGDGVRLMNCTILGKANIPDIQANAIVYAANNGAVIAQCSWGFDKPNVTYKALEDAIDYFIAEAGNAIDFPQSPMRGGVVVCAMGNDGRVDEMYFPAAYPQTISVSATNIRGQKPTYSNIGYWVTIAAPGGADPATDTQGPGVMSCIKGGYGSMSGTSMAAPHVSGVAALLVADNPGITAAQLRERIETSGKNTTPSDPDFLELMGGGCINASKYIALDDKTAPVAVKNLEFKYVSGNYLFTWLTPVDHGEDEITQTRIYYHWEPITQQNLSSARHHTIPTSQISGSDASFDIKYLLDVEIAPQ